MKKTNTERAYEAIQKHVQKHVTGGANPKLALWAQDNFGPAQKRASTLERVGEGFYALSRRKRIIFHKSRKETKNEQDGE